MTKIICLTILLLTVASCTPSVPPRQDAYKFLAGDACHAPIAPVGYADQGAISNFQMQRDKFIECVQHEDPASPTYQSDLDQSMALIGQDQTQGVGIIQQQVPRPFAR